MLFNLGLSFDQPFLNKVESENGCIDRYGSKKIDDEMDGPGDG